ncbi:uncharacterized protein LOC141614770 [Silene latifolia]|uniref:uncharacterized protein LOC141614770 n=1 Tax=Silene latifolia TaxID=37657 RepID=UPI003D782E93
MTISGDSIDSSENLLPYAFYDDPLYITNHDQPTNSLVDVKFAGRDFMNWKREIMLALMAKNKEGFITGTCSRPAETDKKYYQWKRVDLLVRQWILHSMYVNSSKQLWGKLIERYGQINSLELYQLKKDLGSISQDNSIRLFDREMQSKLIQMLMGLNSGFENIKSNILTMEPMPTINKVLGLLQKVETQKESSDSVSTMTEANAYATIKQPSGQSESASKKPKLDAKPKPIK